MPAPVRLIKKLTDLGFTAGLFPDAGDFFLQNDSDGEGDYIRQWNSDQPCPFPELLFDAE